MILASSGAIADDVSMNPMRATRLGRRRFWPTCMAAVVTLVGCLRPGEMPGAGGGGASPSPGDQPGGMPPAGDPNTPPSDPNADLPRGEVDAVFCDDFAALADLPKQRRTGVFQSLSGEFGRWRSGDDAALDADASLLRNLSRGLDARVEFLGELEAALALASVSSNGELLRLSDGGLWVVEVADRLTAIGWRASDEIVVAGDAGAGTLRALVNVTQCQALRARLQS